MHKTVTVTVPPQTTATNPVQEYVKLAKGTLDKVVIRPAPGPNWEVYIKVKYREFSLIPLNDDEWIPLERWPVEVNPEFDSWDGGYEMLIECCSPGARYSHTVEVEFHVLEKLSIRQMVQAFVSGGFKWLRL